MAKEITEKQGKQCETKRQMSYSETQEQSKFKGLNGKTAEHFERSIIRKMSQMYIAFTQFDLVLSRVLVLCFLGTKIQ